MLFEKFVELVLPTETVNSNQKSLNELKVISKGSLYITAVDIYQNIVVGVRKCIA